MTSHGLAERWPHARRAGSVTGLEVGIVGVALVLSVSAVVPLVFNPESRSSDVIRDPVSRPAWLLVYLFTLVVFARFHREILAAAGRNPALVFVCVLAVLSASWSSDGSLTLKHALELALTTLLGFYIGVRFPISKFVALTGWVTLAILILSAVFALAAPKYGLDAVRGNTWRGVFTTKNELARTMVLGGMVWAIRALTGEISRRLGLLTVAGFVAVGYASGSRTALAVTVLLIGVYVLVSPSPNGASASGVALRGLVASVLSVSMVFAFSSQTFLLGLVGSDTQLTGRAGIWSAVWTAIDQRPLLGYGFDAFWRGAQGPSWDVWITTGSRPPHSHNGFLDLTLALGFVGLAAVVAAIAVVLQRSVAAARVGQGAARLFPVLFVAFVIFYNLTESSLLAGNSILWLMFVAVATALPLRETERRRREVRLRSVSHVRSPEEHEQ